MKNTELEAQCRQIAQKEFTGNIVILIAGRDPKLWYRGGAERAVIVWQDERQTHLTTLWRRINKIVKAAKSEAEALREIEKDSEVKIIWRAQS